MRSNMKIHHLILKLIRQGKTPIQISHETNLPYNIVKSLVRTRENGSINFDYTDISQDMTKDQAIEYLINCIHIISDVEFIYEKQELLNLRLGEARLLEILEKASPRVATMNSILNAIYFDKHPGDEIPETNIISVTVCTLRKKLPEGYGEIVNKFRIGYKFIPGPNYKKETR